MARSVFNKVPPYSIVSEKLVIGAMLKTPEVIAEIRPIIADGTVFFRSENGKLYDALLRAGSDRKTPSPGALLELLARPDLAALAGGAKGVHELVEGAPGPDAAISHAENVAEKARKRALIDAVADILHDAYHTEKDFQTLLAEARKRFNKLGREQTDRRDGGTKEQRHKGRGDA